MTNGSAIISRRRMLRMTQEHLAGAAGVSRSTVQRAEKGMALSDENLRSLLSALQMTLDDLADPPAAQHAPQGGPERAGQGRVLLVESVAAAMLFVGLLVLLRSGDWFEAYPDTPEGASWRFIALMGYLAYGWTTCMVLGRILWRQVRHPRADGIVLTRRLCLPFGLLRVPGAWWTQEGRHVSTWPGAFLAALLCVACAFTLHYPWANRPFLGSVLQGVGFQPAFGVSAAWSVVPGSQLGKAGLRIGDQVLSADGVAVGSRADLMARIADAEGRTIDVSVARPRADAGTVPVSDIVTLRLDVLRNPDCSGRVACGWAGDLSGLFTPMKASPSIYDDAGAFAREVGTVVRMIIDPSHRERSELVGDRPTDYGGWLRWVVFRTTAGTASGLLAYALATALLISSLRLGFPWLVGTPREGDRLGQFPAHGPA